MSLKLEMPTEGGMTAAQRLERAKRAQAVTDSTITLAPAAEESAQQPAAAAPVPVADGAVARRPWEKVVVSEKAASKRLPIIMSVALRAKLEYLADVEPGESMSSIAIAGIEAECYRQEKAAGVLPESEFKKVRARVEDKRASTLSGEDTRMVLLVPGSLQSRMDLLIKDFKVAKDRTKLALPGIEDECNRRLKARGEL
jgi:hypothetical protein